jgi:hypothetical protein
LDVLQSVANVRLLLHSLLDALVQLKKINFAIKICF